MNSNGRMLDAINCSPCTSYTQIKNNILRDTNMSFKAKGVLCLLLSNREGWVSYMDAIVSMGTDGITSVNTAVLELEANRYLWRVSYAHKDTKQIAGSFWAYTDTPGEFGMDTHLEWLDNNGFEVSGRSLKKDPRNTQEGPKAENLGMAKQELIILKRKKNIEEEKKDLKTIIVPPSNTPKMVRTKHPKPPIKEPPVQSPYNKLATQLVSIVRSNKRVNITQYQLSKWEQDIRRLCEQQKINPARVKKALDWYADNIGMEYVPVVESGFSLRDKFLRLEAAAERSTQQPKNNRKPNQSRHETLTPERRKAYDNITTVIDCTSRPNRPR